MNVQQAARSFWREEMWSYQNLLLVCALDIQRRRENLKDMTDWLKDARQI